MKQAQRINDLLNLSYINRWAITPMFRTQTVAEHSFRVAIIANQIAEYMNQQRSLEIKWDWLLYWALIHDAPESYTGDIPKPFKSSLGGNVLYSAERQLCPWWANDHITADAIIHVIVHIADSIEALDWVHKHGRDAKWKFEPCPDRLLRDILIERIMTEVQSAYFAHNSRLPFIRQAVLQTLEDMCLNEYQCCYELTAVLNREQSTKPMPSSPSKAQGGSPSASDSAVAVTGSTTGKTETSGS